MSVSIKYANPLIVSLSADSSGVSVESSQKDSNDSVDQGQAWLGPESVRAGLGPASVRPGWARRQLTRTRLSQKSVNRARLG